MSEKRSKGHRGVIKEENNARQADTESDHIAHQVLKNITDQIILKDLVAYLEKELNNANSRLFEIERAANDLHNQMDGFSKTINKFYNTLG